MPKQEVFFEQKTGDRRVEVLKTYDRSYAREVFKGIGDDARGALAAALELEKNYEPADIPDPNGSDYDDFLWDELLETAPIDTFCRQWLSGAPADAERCWSISPMRA